MKTEKKTEVKETEKYPGVAVDVADDDKVTEKAVKQDVKKLGNNPRNNDKLV